MRRNAAGLAARTLRVKADAGQRPARATSAVEFSLVSQGLHTVQRERRARGGSSRGPRSRTWSGCSARLTQRHSHLPLSMNAMLGSRVARPPQQRDDVIFGHRPKLNGPHILRRTFCSHLAMRGAQTRAIRELAGHGDRTTTQRYVHLVRTRCSMRSVCWKSAIQPHSVERLWRPPIADRREGGCIQKAKAALRLV